MNEIEKPRRRWGTFSLRTMFVLMTLFCCWLGWEMSIVRQRQATLQKLRVTGMYHIVLSAEIQKANPLGKPGKRLATIPVTRAWLGGQAVEEIWYPPHFRNEAEPEIQRLARLFPEARLIHSPPEQLMEPCHPGCFPRGTLVETPSGPRSVDGIEAGESILAFLPSGESQVIQVQTVFVTDNRIWKVETDSGSLFTTQTQPLCVADGTTLQAGQLQSGDQILRREGEQVIAVQVFSITPTDRTEKVFNLILGNSEIFVANGFLARSKPPKSGQKSGGEIAVSEK